MNFGVITRALSKILTSFSVLKWPSKIYILKNDRTLNSKKLEIFDHTPAHTCTSCTKARPLTSDLHYVRKQFDKNKKKKIPIPLKFKSLFDTRAFDNSTSLSEKLKFYTFEKYKFNLKGKRKLFFINF